MRKLRCSGAGEGDETHDSRCPRGGRHWVPHVPIPKPLGLLLASNSPQSLTIPSLFWWQPGFLELSPLRRRPRVGAKGALRAVCGEWPLSVLKAPSLASQPPAWSLFLPRSGAQAQAHWREGTQGKGCGCKDESPVKVRISTRGHLRALLEYGFWGVWGRPGPAQEAAHPLHSRGPSPLCGPGEGSSEAYSEPPAPTLTQTEALPAQEAGPGSGCRKPDVAARTAGNNQPRKRPGALSQALICLCLPASLSRRPAAPHTPTPPHRPHSSLPGRTKVAPTPGAPTLAPPKHMLPSLQSDPKLSKCPLSICSDGPSSGTLAATLRIRTRRAPHPMPRGALRRPCPQLGSPKRSLPGPGTRPAPTWPGHSAARSESARRSRPFARSEAPSGPLRAGARPPAPDPLGPNASSASRAAAPSGPQPASGAALEEG